MTTHRSRIVCLLAILVVLLVVGAALGLRRYLSQRAQLAFEMHENLARELTNIPMPPQTNHVRHVDAFRGSHGNVANYYTTSLSYDEIRAYYDLELETRGWKLKGESKLETWGKDVGESSRIYCKNPIAANVYFTGKNEVALGFKYSVSISWRVVDECGSS